MAFTIIAKGGWGGRPADSCTKQLPNDLLGVAVHHTASPRSAATKEGSARLVQSVQRYHMDISDEGYVDIAYNFLFDKWGQIFAGRGWECRSGANGTAEANRNYLSFCYLGHSDLDGFPEAAQDACAWLLKEAFSKGVGVNVKPHSAFGTGTACPGDEARRWVISGSWKADLPPTNTRKVQYLLVDDGEVVWKSTRVPVTQSKPKLESFLRRLESEHVDALHRRLAAEGRLGNVRLVRKIIV